MAETTPRISVVIATYRPGDAFERVVRSLDAQTLPPDQFEVIAIDDGSPDDTFDRLRRVAGSRTNFRVHRIENSGWPSRPRNIGTSMARAPYVLFMDHDDSLFPHALERLADYAEQTGADVVSPKESKTSDVWWGAPALVDGNIDDAAAQGGINRMLPMVPHKLYRREFLLGRGVAFPEGRRLLWEDIYVNVEAYAKAERVAVLADTPAYLWHSSPTNNSKTYGPGVEEYWDRLDDLMAFIDTTLAGPDLESDRLAMVAHQFSDRVVGRLSAWLDGRPASAVRMATDRARAIQARYVPEDLDPSFGAITAARSALLRADRPDLLASLFQYDKAIGQATRTVAGRWDGPILHLDIRSSWRRQGPLVFDVDGDRVVRRLPADVATALPASLTDVAGELSGFQMLLGLRSVEQSITWPLAVPVVPRFQPRQDGGVELIVDGRVAIDTESVAGGRPLDAGTWAAHVYTKWLGVARRGRFVIAGAPAGVSVSGGRTRTAFRDAAERLSIAVDDTSRSVLIDGGLTLQGVRRGAGGGFSAPVPRARASETQQAPVEVLLVPVAHGGGEANGSPRRLPGVLTTRPDGASLECAEFPPPGSYLLAVQEDGSRSRAVRW